jgi:FkbM family methyltransferase
MRARIGNALMRLMPDSELLYRLGRRVVNRYQSDNNIDLETNGELRLMETYLPRASVVFDVGANVGEWTARALQINAHAQYHCFEPSAKTFGALAARHLPGNVRINHFGLGDRAQERELHVFSDGCGANSLYDRVGTDEKAREVETIRLDTLDAYCAANAVQRIGFLKIDVEGHELSVLRGAQAMLAEGNVDVVQFEYGGTYIDARVLLKDVFELVARINPRYRIHKLFPCGPRLVADYHQMYETFQYSNWALILDGGVARS